MTFGQRLWFYRKERGLSIHALRRVTHISARSLYLYEHDRRMPRLRLQVNIAHALGVQVRTLWGEMTDQEILGKVKSWNQ